MAERVVQGATIHTYWRCEDQLISCIGQIDENGWRTMQTSYLAFGEALRTCTSKDRSIRGECSCRLAGCTVKTPA